MPHLVTPEKPFFTTSTDLIQTDLLSQLLDAHRLHDRIPAPDMKP